MCQYFRERYQDILMIILNSINFYKNDKIGLYIQNLYAFSLRVKSGFSDGKYTPG